LRSPETGQPLELQSFAADGDDIKAGRLIDNMTGIWFRIENGIVDLTPLALRSKKRYLDFAQRFNLENSPTPIATPGNERAENAQRKQIDFFDSQPDKYVKEVVSNPYSLVLDRVTFGDWATRTLKPGARVLEIGCGPGRQTLPLVRLGMRSVGLDLSEGLLLIAQRELEAAGLATRADLIVSSAEAFPIADNDFDACVIYGSLHHFANPQIVLAKAAAALRPGGHFYMLEPHKSPVRFIFEWLMRVRPLWQEEASEDPLFTERQFREWLGRGNIQAEIRWSTYLPPHFFYGVGQRIGELSLKWTDAVFSGVPGLRKLGGVIIAEGVKLDHVSDQKTMAARREMVFPASRRQRDNSAKGVDPLSFAPHHRTKCRLAPPSPCR
jgi:ubiquinone/menaquinone biosynthesis C-methylase UbiE